MSEDTIPNTGEGYQVRPFYLCIDVSGSMGPVQGGSPPWLIDVVNDDLDALLRRLHSELEVSEVIRLALISFAETAKIECPLSNPDKVMSLPKLQAGGQTSYLEPLKKLREVIEQDYQHRKPHKWYRPVVLFITDGYPNKESDQEWQAARDKLIDPDWFPHPIFVVFGFGEANEKVIEALATGQKYTGLACMAAKNETSTNQISRIISTLQISMISSAHNPGQFMINTEGYHVLTQHNKDSLG